MDTNERLRALQRAFAAASAAALAACGGGGGSSSPPQQPPAPPPAPAMSSTLSASSASTQVVQGNVDQLAFTVQVTNPRSATMVPVVTSDSANVAVGAIDTSVANQYTVHLATPASLAFGKHHGTVTFKLCADAACSVAYDGGTQAFVYDVSVTLDDWKTFQRDPSHTGYVELTLDPSAFATAWTWTRPAGDGEPVGGINAVATGKGQVFVTKDIYFGQGAVYALDEATGVQKWTYALGAMASEGPAAFADGTVYVPSMDGSEHGAMWAIDAVSGQYRFKMATTSQWSSFFAPTVLGDTIVQSTQAGDVYDFSTADGTQRWSKPAGTWDQSTPALDATRVVIYGDGYAGAAMQVFDRTTGAPLASIADPFTSGVSNYSMFSATLLGSTNDAISFSGGGFSGQAASSSEQFDSRVLVDYDLAKQAVGWRSADAYMTHPALANGVLYAARNAPAALDAMSEADGHVLWSWTPPAGDTGFHRNIVATRNLLFVSTDQNVYAVNLATHQAVWHYPKPGMLAISGAGMLYISTGARVSDGGLVAVNLLP